jgi:regulator of replication initiation timing
VTKASDLKKNVNDFVKENKNHRCENFTISDLYDMDLVAREKEKALIMEKRMLAAMKPPSHEV